MAKKRTRAQERDRMARKSGELPSPPRTRNITAGFHDLIQENLSPARPWAEDDLAYFQAEGRTDPLHRLSQEPTLYRDMLSCLAGASLPGTWPRAAYLPGLDGQPPRSVAESLALAQLPMLEEMYTALLSLNLAGNRIYSLSEAFVQRMLATKLDMPNERIRLPFPAISVTARHETMVRTFLGPRRQHEYGPEMGVVLCASLKRDDQGSKLRITSIRVAGRQGEETMSAIISFDNGGRVAESIAQFIDDRNVRPDGVSNGGYAYDWFDENASAYYRTVLNCLLYLTIPNAHVGPFALPPNNTSDPLASRIRVGIAEVGRDMKPLVVRPGEMFEKERMLVKAPGTGRKLDHLVLVSGHYRDLPRQQHLPEADRREIWIEPYIKGPDGTERQDKTYVVR